MTIQYSFYRKDTQNGVTVAYMTTSLSEDVGLLQLCKRETAGTLDVLQARRRALGTYCKREEGHCGLKTTASEKTSTVDYSPLISTAVG